ncbi:MAG TPA: hypothetical protein VGM39_23625 [Kofleriaceae bacterium]|jgi:hypothetical protein
MDPDRPIVRWSLIVLWVAIAILLYQPAFVFIGWPVLLMAFAAGLFWTAQDFGGVRHQEEPLDHRWSRNMVRIELAVTTVVATLCVVLATSLVLRHRNHGYAMSTTFVPVMLSVVLVATLAALRTPSPKRLAIASLALLSTGPLLAAVHLFALPFFNLDADRVQYPLMYAGYAIGVLVLGALGIHLGIVARRRGYGSEIIAPPPQASLVIRR